MEEWMRKEYINESCVLAFRALIEKPKDKDLIEEVIKLAMPVLGIVMATQFKRLRPGTEEYDEVLSRTPFQFYRTLLSDSFYKNWYDAPDTHFAWLYGMFRYEVLNALKDTKKSVAKFDGSIVARHVTTFDPKYSPAAVELKIFSDQLPSYIFTKAKELIRFSGNEKKACEAILENFINGRLSVPRRAIRDRFKLNDKFFTQYCRVILRKALIEIQAELGDMPSVLEEESMWQVDRNISSTFNEGFHISSPADWWMGVDKVEADAGA